MPWNAIDNCHPCLHLCFFLRFLPYELILRAYFLDEIFQIQLFFFNFILFFKLYIMVLVLQTNGINEMCTEIIKEDICKCLEEAHISEHEIQRR